MRDKNPFGIFETSRRSVPIRQLYTAARRRISFDRFFGVDNNYAAVTSRDSFNRVINKRTDESLIGRKIIAVEE